MDGIGALIKEVPERSLAVYTIWDTVRKQPIYESGSKLLPDTIFAGI